VVWFHCAAQVSAIGQRYQLNFSPVEQKILGFFLKLDLGVPFFFTISAICISASIENRAAAGGGVLDFILARIERIYPPFWVALGIWVMVALVTPPELATVAPVTGPQIRELSALGWVANLVLAERIVSSLAGAAIPCILGLSWSLSYEVQFYAVMGTFLFSRRLFWCAILLVSFMAVGSSVLQFFGEAPIGYGFLSDGIGLYFLLGTCSYQSLKGGARWLWRSISGGIAALSTLGVILNPSSSVGYLAMVAIGAQFLTRSLGQEPSAASGGVWLRWLQHVGVISYSLYLIHPACGILIPNILLHIGLRDFGWLLGASLLVTTVVALMAASLFHALIEQRFLSRRHSRG